MKKKGTTLIEVLVTAVILSMAGASVLMSFVHCHKAILESTHRYNSSMIINEHLEELSRKESEPEIVQYIGVWDKKEFKKEISEGNFATYTLRLEPEYNLVDPTAISNLSRITATVLWNTSEGERSYSMSIYTNEPG